MRSIWKLPYIHPMFLNKHFLNKKSFKTFLRYPCITSKLVNKKLKVYNGLCFKDVTVRSNQVGFKTGEFFFTKKKSLNIHIKKRRKKILKKTKKK